MYKLKNKNAYLLMITKEKLLVLEKKNKKKNQ